MQWLASLATGHLQKMHQRTHPAEKRDNDRKSAEKLEEEIREAFDRYDRGDRNAISNEEMNRRMAVLKAAVENEENDRLLKTVRERLASPQEGIKITPDKLCSGYCWR
ncbi:hypothetical protein AAH446_03085 [Erwinia sp. P6884]|uniref:hypothetical protein n=1 Tax=Erwinia sp. P6884 TaxID=3141450 RepID=UPI00318FFDA7